MKRPALALLLAAALAACGVDGPPRPPAQDGATLSGTARIGLAGGG